jgi:hypothetical protein
MIITKISKANWVWRIAKPRGDGSIVHQTYDTLSFAYS